MMTLQEAAPSLLPLDDKQSSRTQVEDSYNSNTGGDTSGYDDDDENNGYQSSSYASTVDGGDDDDDDDDDTNSAYNSRASDRQGVDDTTKDLARNETRWVQYVRCLIVIMLIGSTAIASFLAYRILSQNERHFFEQQVSCIRTSSLKVLFDNYATTFDVHWTNYSPRHIVSVRGFYFI
jgi:hypothetical protein